MTSSCGKCGCVYEDTLKYEWGDTDIVGCPVCKLREELIPKKEVIVKPLSDEELEKRKEMLKRSLHYD